MTSTYERHLAAITSGKVDKTNIIGIRKALNAHERMCYLDRGNPNHIWTRGQVLSILRAIEAYHPTVTGELHDSGILVLRNKRYAKWLEHFAASIEALDHFRLVRFDFIGDRAQCAVPVYAAWVKIPPKGDALDGGTFESFWFRNIPWQSGGNGPEIVR